MALTGKPTLTDKLKTFAAPAPRSRIEHIGGFFAGFSKNGQGWKAICPIHDDNNPSLSISENKDGRILLHCFAGCSTQMILDCAGLRMADLAPGASLPRRLVARYGYRDDEGELLYEVVRYDPKDFRQRRPDGNGGWTWKLDDVRRVPYRLPQLIAADPAEPVFIVEGEKDADRLAKLGLVATTNSGGAGKQKPEV